MEPVPEHWIIMGIGSELGRVAYHMQKVVLLVVVLAARVQVMAVESVGVKQELLEAKATAKSPRA